MTTAFVNGRIFTGSDILENHIVEIDGAEIVGISPANGSKDYSQEIDLNGALLAPGYIDVQVNGGGGVLFNNDPSVDSIRVIGKAHRQFGTCGFLPTLISDDLDKVERAIEAVDKAIIDGVSGVLGIHIEGPFLNTDRKGIHDASKFRKMSPEHVSLLSSLKHGKTLVTLAPENASPELIRSLSQSGVIVSIGHTNATYETAVNALSAGATGFTHLFNAMSQFINREPGVVGAALENQKAWCGIIVDGQHVSKTALKLAFKCKPLEKFMLVTDAMPTVGSSSKNFTLQTKEIKVVNGVCVANDGTLAGSNLSMERAVKNAVSWLELEPLQAFRMASKNPAEFIGLSSKYGRIAPGYQASFVALSDNQKVLNTWIDGKSELESTRT